MITSFNPIRGKFQLKVFNAAGELVEDYLDENLVVTSGKRAMALMLAGDPSITGGDKVVATISFGSSQATPDLSDVGITSGFEKALSGYTYPTDNSVQFLFTLELSENNGATIAEFGLLCADGSLFARKVREPISKTNVVRLEGAWTITF